MKKILMSQAVTYSLILYIIFNFFLLNFPYIPEGDSPAYIVLGKSLSLGYGYRDICFPGVPGHHLFPIGFPFLLGFLIHFFGYNFLLMRLLIFIMAVGSLWLVYVLFKRLNDKLTAQLVFILTVSSSQFVAFSTMILSEIPYLFFSLLVLIFVEKYKLDKKWGSKNLFFIILFTLLACSIRSIGIILVIVALCYLIFEKENKHKLSLFIKKFFWGGLVVAIVLLVLSGISWFSSYTNLFFHQRSADDLEKNCGLLLMIARNIYSLIFYIFPKIIFGMQYFTQRNLIAFIITGIVLYGFILRAIKKRTIIEYYFVFYLFILSFYFATAIWGQRFLIPLLPLIFYYFIIGAEGILQIVILGHGDIKRNIFIAIVCILIIFNILGNVNYISAKAKKDYTPYYKLAGWIKTNTCPETILASYEPYPLYIYTQRKYVVLPYAITDTSVLFDILRKRNVEYVVISFFSYEKACRFIKNMFTKSTNKFSIVYKEGNNVIYKLESH